MTAARFFCIDGHTCGNPVRLVAGGGPRLDGATMAERRAHFMAEHDWIRAGLMFEPRGHDMMSGAILYPPTRPDCDIGVLYIETTGCLPMCGHGTIGTVTFALENGLVRPATPGRLRLDTPAGLVTADYEIAAGRVRQVRITNVPSFLYAAGLEIVCPDLGPLTVDVAYGGNFYAIIEPQETYTDMADYPADRLIAWGRALRERLNAAHAFRHPANAAIDRLTHVQWTGRPRDPRAHGRNAVIYGEKAIDRSPCGTGTSARMAQLHARGALAVGDDFVHESIIGSLFDGRVEAVTQVAGRSAIVPSIAGWARQTGTSTITIDPEDDPFAHGFSVI